MTTPTQTNVAKLYVAFFGRAPDSVGLDYWVNKSNLDLEGICKSFFEQPETVAKYGTLDSSAFITEIYKNVLNREPDAGGLAYWVGELGNGNISKDNMILAIINGAQNEDVTLLENKADVGLYFAANNQDDAPNAFDVISETKYTTESVAAVKQWIDGEIPDYATPSTYFVLNDTKQDYKIDGSAKDDVFMVQKYKSASIYGGEGSDTLDFSKFPNVAPAGVAVNLSTGLGPNGMKFSWIENVRGTDGNDSLTGNSDANILVSGGVGNAAGDTIDGGVGNDRILFENIEDVARSTINGGQNEDTLEITTQTAINVGISTFNNVSDVETLQVGYSKEGKASAATITVATDGNFGTIKEIRGTSSTNTKGVATNDVIQARGNLDVSNIKLTSIEELTALAANTYIKVGSNTLAGVSKVNGDNTATTDLWLDGKAGVTADLTSGQFTNIDRVVQTAPVANTIIVNQSLINSLANSNGNDGFGVARLADSTIDPAATDSPGLANNRASFNLSTLTASGIGLDLSVLADGDSNFKAINFGTAHEVTVGNINDGGGTINDLIALTSIVGSENNADLLRIKPNSGKAITQDLTSIAITKVERLDFEEVGTVILKNSSLGGAVIQISGDDDAHYAQAFAAQNIAATGHTGAGGPNVFGTVIDASAEAAVGGLKLTDMKLENIVGFGNGATPATITVNSGTTGLEGVKSLDTGSNQTIIAADAGAYDLSGVIRATNTTVDFLAATPVTFADRFVGSAGNDIVKGGAVGIGYQLGDGDDSFIGTNTASEVVQGGAGNDNIALGNNTEAVLINRDGAIGSVLPTAEAASQAADVKFQNYIDMLNAAGLAPANTINATTFGKLPGVVGAYANGGAGNDTITSGSGNDVLVGGDGHDSLSGGADNDVLSAGAGDDILSGGAGIDFMAGGTGNDLLEGNAGEDFLMGGKGQDVLRGGELTSTGAVDYGVRDHFIFNAGDSGETDQTVDIIKDFFSSTRATGALAGTGDVIELNWFAADASVTGVPKDVTADTTGSNTAGAGNSYDTHFMDLGSGFGISSADSLLAAADLALDKLYELQDLEGKLATNADFTSTAVQFEYGGKEYLVVDAYVIDPTAVDGTAASLVAGQTANNYNAANDLLLQISDTAVSWSLNANDIVVTRWLPETM